MPRTGSAKLGAFRPMPSSRTRAPCPSERRTACNARNWRTGRGGHGLVHARPLFHKRPTPEPRDNRLGAGRQPPATRKANDMSERAYGVVVIGAGVVGLAAAWHLLRLGCRPLAVVERFRVGHANGSSHGSVRITRSTYATPAY